MSPKFNQVLFNLFRLDQDKASNKVIHQTISSATEIKGTNMLILMMAIFIASIGLNTNSTAVIIGAMLISPLMGCIMAIGYGMAINDMALVKKAVKGLGIQVLISLIVSTIYFKISPISIAQSELLARTNPTIWDVLIAIFGGMAGIVGVTRKEKSNVIPGVAIATALMPPLCTVGYGLANGNATFYLGAFYLFFINGFFICLTTCLMIRLMGIPRKTYINEAGEEQEEKIQKWTIAITILTILPSLYFGYQLVMDSIIDSNITRYIDSEFKFDNTRVVNRYISKENHVIEIALVGSLISDDVLELLSDKLTNYSLDGYQLKVTQGEMSSSLGTEDVKNILSEELYAQNQVALSDKEKKIELLESELLKYKLTDYAVEQMSKELKALYSGIESFSVGNQKVYNAADDSTSNHIVATLRSSVTLSTEDQERIKAWIGARTGGGEVLLYVESPQIQLEELLVEE